VLVDGTGENGLAFVFDEASEQDSLDGQVARSWAHGVRACGKQGWLSTLRVALRLHGEAPWTAKQAKERQDELLGLLHRSGVQAAIVMQSPATPGVRQVHSAWNILGHAGNPYKWAGTAERRNNLYVCPILHPFNYEYVYAWLIERWIRQALELAKGAIHPLTWPQRWIHPGWDMLGALHLLAQQQAPLAVDIETNLAGTIITAIGLSDGTRSVSAPWHAYPLADGNGEREAALVDRPLGPQIQLAIENILEDNRIKKILHNGAFDVLELAKHGITLAGFEHDTLLMHRVVYPQYRHGLQQACATEFCVEPWKTLHRPPKVSAGADPWLAAPVDLRTYNSKDTAATWHLWNCLKGKLG
jgi:hypothetical protein